MRSSCARTERFKPNASCSPLDRQRFSEGGNTRFAAAVRGNFMKPHKRRKRADVDDAPIALLDHVPAEPSASAQGALQICFEDGIPFGFRKFERRHSFGATGTIHENLDAAERIAN